MSNLSRNLVVHGYGVAASLLEFSKWIPPQPPRGGNDFSWRRAGGGLDKLWWDRILGEEAKITTIGP